MIRDKISNKIFYISSLLLVFIFIAFGSWSFYKTHLKLENKLNTTIDLLSNLNKDYILTRDYITLDQISKELARDEDINKIMYYDQFNNLISFYSRNALEEKDFISQKKAVFNGKNVVGYIELGLNKKQVYYAVLETVLFLLLTLIVLFITYNFILNKMVVRPVEEMIHVAKEISEGNFEKRMRGHSVDEFGFLAQVFNSMLDKIVEEQKELHHEIDLNREVESKLRKSEQSLERAQQIAQLGNWEYIIPKDEMIWSKEVFRILGYGENEVDMSLSSIYEHVHEEDREFLANAVDRTLKEGNLFNVDFRIIHSDGKIKYAHVEGEILFNEKRRPERFIGIIQDITWMKESEEKLNYIAFHDALTHLPNRLLFLDRLKESLTRAERNKTLVGLFFLDLDRFKVINDTLGHSVGDTLLQKVSKRLSSVIRKSDTVSRLGGDEFTVLLPDITNYSSIITVAEKIISVMKKEFILMNHEFYVTTSIGIACYPHDGKNGEVLLKNADIAMYQAKSLGGNRYYFYSDTFTELSLTQLKLETKFRKAIEKDEFELHYQPQFNLKTGQLVGIEALTYWNHQGDVIGPGEFIPLAEETGLIGAIGDWVIRRACEQNKEWLEKGYPIVPIAVNISAKQFNESKLIKTLNSVLANTGLQSHYLEIELTESLLMNAEVILPYLNAIKEMGIRISIDDFGTGFSSLSYLRQFPIDKLKIDRSFISNLSNNDNTVITNAIINLSHSLRLKTIAEGVETEEQASVLKELNCEEVQGYLYGRPVVASEFVNHFEDKDEETF